MSLHNWPEPEWAREQRAARPKALRNRQRMNALIRHTISTLAAIGLCAALVYCDETQAEQNAIASMQPATAPYSDGPRDSWAGRDKALHFVGCGAIAGAVTLVTDSRTYGFLSCAAVGAAKEIADSRSSKHQASWRDFAADVLGGWVGSYLGFKFRRWFITPRFNADGSVHGATLAVAIPIGR